MITSTKLSVLAVTLSINDNIKFLEDLKQRVKRTICWNKYRSKITTQPKNNNLDCMIDPTFTNNNRLFVKLFNVHENDLTWNSFVKFNMPVVQIKGINVLINNKPTRKKNKKRMKNLLKCKETMNIQQETYQIVCATKTIKISLELIFQDKEVLVFH